MHKERKNDNRCTLKATFNLQRVLKCVKMVGYQWVMFGSYLWSKSEAVEQALNMINFEEEMVQQMARICSSMYGG